jgi:hypothetical protein
MGSFIIEQGRVSRHALNSTLSINLAPPSTRPFGGKRVASGRGTVKQHEAPCSACTCCRGYFTMLKMRQARSSPDDRHLLIRGAFFLITSCCFFPCCWVSYLFVHSPHRLPWSTTYFPVNSLPSVNNIEMVGTNPLIYER